MRIKSLLKNVPKIIPVRNIVRRWGVRHKTATPDNDAGSEAIISGVGKVYLDSNCKVFAFSSQDSTERR